MSSILDLFPKRISIVVLFAFLIGLVKSYLSMRKLNVTAKSCAQKPFNLYTYWRDMLRGVFRMPALLDDWYQERGGKTFVIPTLMYGPIVLVAPSLVREYRNQYDDVFSSLRAEFKALHFQHVFPHPAWLITKKKRPRVKTLVQVLANVMGKDLAGTISEVKAAIDESFGGDKSMTNRKEVSLVSSMLHIYGRNISRVFVGKQYSENKDYVTSLMKTLNSMLSSGFSLGLFPDSLRSYAAKIVCKPVYRNRKIMEDKYLNAMFDEKKKVAVGDIEAEDMETYRSGFIAAAAVEAKEISIPDTKESLINNFLAQHLGGTHTTAMKVFKIYGRLCQFPHLVDRLRTQATEVFANPYNTATWTKDELDQLTLFDSVITETLRFDPTGFAMLRRVCMKPEGFTFDDGTHIPLGFEVAVAVSQIHEDPRYYDKPKEFDPDRWMRMFETNKMLKEESPDEEQMFGIPFINLSFLSWGDGRHACPGRYFASRIMKVTLAYSVLNYDMEYGLRQSDYSQWQTSFGNYNVPLEKRVVFRRRDPLHTHRT